MRATPHPIPLWPLALLLGFALGPTCGQPSQLVRLHAPLAEEIFVTDVVGIEADAGRGVAVASLALEVGGVDLADALGLVPPFADEGGVVLLGGEAVTVSGFTIATPAAGPHFLEATLSGVPAGTWLVEVSGEVAADASLVSAARDFSVVESMALGPSHVPAAGLPGGAVALPSEGVLGNAAFGQPLAAPPVATLGGQTVRTGHVEAAEALVGSGGP